MKCTLVSWPVVRTLKHLSKREIFAHVDIGDFLWVFDIASPDASHRCLRFWLEEIHAPEKVRLLPMDDALDRIIGTDRPRVRLSEVVDMLEVDWRHGSALGRLMGAATVGVGPGNRVTWVPRAGLKTFLTGRWLVQEMSKTVQGRMF